MRKNIVITGMGKIAAKQISSIKHLHFDYFKYPVGEVDCSNTQLKEMLDIPSYQEVSRTALLGICALKQAAENAGVTSATEGKKYLISGTTVGGMDLTEQYWAQIDSHVDVMLQHDCGSCTELTAKYFGFFDDVTTISTACSSGANAILEGAEILEAGLADIVFAGGAEALTRFHLMGFSSLMILDDKVCRPFADDRAGLNLGEGAAFVVMETEENARKRGANILCYFAGGGNACDAHHQTASSADGEGAYRAMKQAIADANISPEYIGYVNAHGTGTVNNDASETAALRRIFGDNMPLIESTKSITGHTTSAAGAIEAVICIQKLQENPSLRYAMDNSFGFGGNDTSLIFSRIQHPNHQYPHPNNYHISSKVELTSEDEISEIKKFLKPSEYRRMGKLLKASLLTSLKALQESGIDVPDAIVTATSLGCWENSEKILDDITEPKPTLFMQSTHNTIGSNIAIYLKSHGYNITYTQGAQSLDRAMRKAALLIESGKANSVLVGMHEETTPKYRELMQKCGATDLQPIHSVAMVLVKK
ncbi:MAG: beta-ketoacyl-[acyl-carrier-protein] synthase family protein [Bacteroidales bacterium]|nr:beta-ketoacyl-[acyl-carrier-protein] synthase family protein [Bacteroidales bacterium]